MSTTDLTTVQKVTATLSVVDAKGNPVALPSGVVPTWTVETPGVCTLNGSADPTGMSVEVIAVAVGTTNVTATAVIDAALTLTATGVATVTAAGPSSMSISFGTPANQ